MCIRDSNSDAVIFEPADEVELLTVVKPGGGYNNLTAGTFGSVGYRCQTTLNGRTVYGFVTAAHCLNTGEYASINNTILALATSKRQFRGSLDAVFCQIQNGHSVGTIITGANETLRNGVDANLAQGHPISKSGVTTGVTSGYVKSLSASYEYNNISFNDMLSSQDLTAQSGDSGGIVYSTRSGSNYVAGTIAAKDSTYVYCTKAININTILGLSMYD